MGLTITDKEIKLHSEDVKRHQKREASTMTVHVINVVSSTTTKSVSDSTVQLLTSASPTVTIAIAIAIPI